MIKCPRCGRIYGEYPALSRRDNRTDICSNCGVEEAMNDFLKKEDGMDKWKVRK